MTNDDKDVGGKRNPPKLLVGMETGAATMENSRRFLKKETKNKNHCKTLSIPLNL